MRKVRAASRAAAVALGLLTALPGCVKLRFHHDNRFEPALDAAIATLDPGRVDLAAALRRLGAPLFVWEHDGDGVALAWGWQEQSGWGITVSYEVVQHAEVSFSYDSVTDDLQGLVLLFDQDLVLRVIRRGYLRDLAGELREQRPALVEDHVPDH